MKYHTRINGTLSLVYFDSVEKATNAVVSILKSYIIPSVIDLLDNTSLEYRIKTIYLKY